MFKHLRRERLEHLADCGLLREDDRPIKEIRDRVRLTILRGETPSPRTAHLISLIHVSGTTHTLFDKDERKEARKKIKSIVKEDLLAQVILQTIQSSNIGAYTGNV